MFLAMHLILLCKKETVRDIQTDIKYHEIGHSAFTFFLSANIIIMDFNCLNLSAL